MTAKKISILGSTGSIGQQTLDIVQAFPDKFSVIGLSAGKNVELLKKQLRQFKPQCVSISDESEVQEIQNFIKSEGLTCDVLYGLDGLSAIATETLDLLIVAIVGTTSLKPTYDAILKGTTIGLACKEVLVSAGDIIMSLAKEKNVPILPIDSEHAALKQCLAGVQEKTSDVSKLILTASGGPFRTTPKETFETITAKEALKHPNWDMGAKITIDSATMMNKGLEVIEAHHLFNMPYEQIEVIVHPESIVHSLVEFTDGTQLAQMGLPDMRFPIQYVLTYPEKWENDWPKTSLSSIQSLHFYDPDFDKFPLLKCAFDAGKQGGTAPAVMNAANEAVVGQFLKGNIGFNDIAREVQQQLDTYNHKSTPTLEEIIILDEQIKHSITYALR